MQWKRYSGDGRQLDDGGQSDDRGQSLVQFSVVIFILLAFLALTLNAGNALSVRRKVQNAADAAALAAARQICLGKDVARASEVASDFLVQNGAKPLESIVTGAIGSCGTNASCIEFRGADNSQVIVNATRSMSNTLFGDLLGIDETDPDSGKISAMANASCGRANSACNLWPIVFKATLWEGIACGKTVAVWDSAINEQIECFIGGQYRPNLCDCYDCDSQDIGKDDFIVVNDYSRGWVDFPTTSDPIFRDVCKESGSGANELKCTLANNYQGRLVLPAWVEALNGVKASALKEVEDRVGDSVRIPLYGNIDTNMTSNCYDVNVDKFYIVKFGCATVEGVEKNRWLYPKPGMPKSYKKVKITAVLVTKNCTGCTTDCGTTDGTVGAPWELHASNLTN